MNYPYLSRTVTTFLFERSAAGCSLHSIAEYRNNLNMFVIYLNDPELNTIDTRSVNEFLNYLKNDYQVKRRGKEMDKLLSPRTVVTVQATLNIFWK